QQNAWGGIAAGILRKDAQGTEAEAAERAGDIDVAAIDRQAFRIDHARVIGFAVGTADDGDRRNVAVGILVEDGDATRRGVAGGALAEDVDVVGVDRDANAVCKTRVAANDRGHRGYIAGGVYRVDRYRIAQYKSAVLIVGHIDVVGIGRDAIRLTQARVAAADRGGWGYVAVGGGGVDVYLVEGQVGDVHSRHGGGLKQPDGEQARCGGDGKRGSADHDSDGCVSHGVTNAHRSTNCRSKVKNPAR